MILIKIGIFAFIIISVKVMFIFFYQEEDVMLYKMKEIIDFEDYLRIYSCSLKMNVNEIIEKYNFKYNDIKLAYEKMLTGFYNIENCSTMQLMSYMKQKINIPDEFSSLLCNIKEYYGTTMSDALDAKLLQTKKEMDRFYDKYECEYKERKGLLNKLSLLLGCLIAIVLI